MFFLPTLIFLFKNTTLEKNLYRPDSNMYATSIMILFPRSININASEFYNWPLIFILFKKNYKITNSNFFGKIYDRLTTNFPLYLINKASENSMFSNMVHLQNDQWSKTPLLSQYIKAKMAEKFQRSIKFRR